MGLTMQVLAWVVLLALGAFFFGDVLEKQFNPNQQLQTHYTQEGVREVTLQRNKFGHYVTSGEINGKPLVISASCRYISHCIEDTPHPSLVTPQPPYRNHSSRPANV